MSRYVRAYNILLVGGTSTIFINVIAQVYHRINIVAVGYKSVGIKVTTLVMAAAYYSKLQII